MKQFLMLAAMLAGLASASYATVPPKDNYGNSMQSADFVGGDTTRLTSASSTNASLAENEAGLVYGVIVSSCAISNYVVLRDSNTANTSSTAMLNVMCEDSGADEDGTIIHKFPIPLKFTNGLSINMNAALTGAGEVVVITRPRLSGAD